MYDLFNSHSALYRAPFGAVAAGQEIHFRICLPRHLKCSYAALSISPDGKPAENIGMFWCGMSGDDHEWWECDFTPSASGIYWHTFNLISNNGKKIHIGKSKYSKGTLCNNSPNEWQITVYEPSFETPGWLAGGLIYQIFPDRFNKSGIDHDNVPGDRKIHSNWDDMPDWEPNEYGKITNSDYFGGDLEGITQKLDYIKSLGVTCIYLNPIFEAHENHRYNTANYEKIDPLLGNERDFERLCSEAGRRGIRIILDGVFSHTGSDSIYFNKNGRYNNTGAYNSPDSEYFSWFKFSNWPDKYDSWWGIITLPEVMEESPAFLDYTDKILKKWINAGASGWRLDVADELPDIFLDNLRKSVKSEKNDALIIGEVWEDATNKIAYSKRRRYLLGKQLDSVMNYPFKDAILGFLKGLDAEDASDMIMGIIENYPPQTLNLLMNHIGTHDTERVITVLAGERYSGEERKWQSLQALDEYQKKKGRELLKLASLIQYTLPGVPSLYYGDEAGSEGYRDPFNRRCYPWSKEDKELLEWYRELGKIRASLPFLGNASYREFLCSGRLFSFIRQSDNNAVFVAVNAGENSCQVTIPEEFEKYKVLLGTAADGNIINLPPRSFSLLKRSF